jgi:DNA-binding SARP family transcriptional activator
VMASAVLMVRAVDVALVRGEFAKAHVLLDRSIERLRPSELSNYIAYRLAEATFSAWLSGDDERFERFASELEALVERNGVRAFAYFSSIVRARKPDDPSGIDLPRWIACGQLVGCSMAGDAGEALRYAKAALAASRSCFAPFMCTLAALAVAEFATGAERVAAFAEARRASLEIESEPLQAAVEAVASGQGDLGMLAPYIERLRCKRSTAPARLEISIVRGTVYGSGVEISLSDRELSLLFALAARPQEVSQARLFEMLWPEFDVPAARNALHVALHRLRHRLGDDEAVVRTGNGYRVRADASVDLWEIERRAANLLKRGRLSEEQHAELKAVYERVRVALPPRVTAWEWFDPIERRISEIRCELAQRLARHALEAGKTREALALADEMIEHDPCDESAREIAVLAHLASGDRAAALRQFRQYRETLRAELHCEPSSSLAQLVGIDSIEAPIGPATRS